MSPFLRALHAEALKLRGTLALWMCLIAPATVVGLYVLQIALSDLSRHPQGTPEAAWLTFAQSALVLWTLLMLPLFLTLEAALLAGLEHANGQWKHLLALPPPRAVHYLAKQCALVAMLAFAMGLLLLLIPLGGWLLGLLKPDFPIAGPPPWHFLATHIGACFAAILLAAALQNWAAIRWRSFTVAVSIGITATVIGFLAGQSATYGHWYPWSMPLQVLAGHGEHTHFVVIVGLAGGMLVTMLGLLDFLRREHG